MRLLVSEQRIIDIKHFYEGNFIFSVFCYFKGLFLSIRYFLYISVIAKCFTSLLIGYNFLEDEY